MFPSVREGRRIDNKCRELEIALEVLMEIKTQGRRPLFTRKREIERDNLDSAQGGKGGYVKKYHVHHDWAERLTGAQEAGTRGHQ